MSTIEFGLMLQPFPTNFPGPELFEYNRRLVRKLSQGFTTLWAEDHLQLVSVPSSGSLKDIEFDDNRLRRF